MAGWQGSFFSLSGEVVSPSQTVAVPVQGVTEKLQKREEERQEKIQKKREEEGESFNVKDSVQLFLDTFSEERDKLENALEDINGVDKSKLADHFDQLSDHAMKLKRFVSESAMYLPAYELKTAQNILVSLQTKIQEKRDELIPKKKFAFRSNKKLDRKTQLEKNSEIPTEMVKDSKSEDDLVIELAACKFVGASNETLQKSAEEINQKDIALAGLDSCKVLLYGAPSAVHINKLKNCKVFCGPVPGSIFIRECSNCTFVLACQQLRIHSTINSHFYIHVTSKAIVEDCNTVKFAPYNWKYDLLDEHYEFSGLSKDRNNWDKVDDFNWLAADAHSPNWSILQESERVTSWEL